MSKAKTVKKNKLSTKGNNNSKNWFLEQRNLTDRDKSNNKSNHYKSLETLPIVKMQMNSKREAEHFEEAYQFALKNSDPNSSEIMTVHLDMNDQLHFNRVQDDTFQSAWKKGELMLLVAFPKNWKTMPMEMEADFDDEDDDEMTLDSAEDRFDYLYETGMSVYEG